MPIAYYDMTALNKAELGDPAQARAAWDTAHLVASIQGIVNREGPRLFVRFMEHPDDFWFDYCRGESGWLADRPVETVLSLDALLRLGQVNGLLLRLASQGVTLSRQRSDLLEQRACSIIQPDITHCGGLTEARRIAAGEPDPVRRRELDEIARMLGGVLVTDKTREHAKEMLRAAQK